MKRCSNTFSSHYSVELAFKFRQYLNKCDRNLKICRVISNYSFSLYLYHVMLYAKWLKT